MLTSPSFERWKRNLQPPKTQQTSPIQNHQGQTSLWCDPARFQVLVAGRRWGKTTYIKEKLLKHSDKPNSTVVYVAPTRGQAKDIIWTPLKDRLTEIGWRFLSNESELKIIRSNGSVIYIKSAEKPGRLRGLGIDFIAFDEYAEYRGSSIWNEVVRPALSDKLGHALFCGTPKGFNQMHELFMSAKTEYNWSSWSFKTLDSPFFQTPEGRAEIEDARKNLSERDFRQEYEASFENFAGRIYSSFDRSLSNLEYNFDASLPVIVGMDFNRSPMTATYHQRVGDKLIQFGELFLVASDTPEVCQIIRSTFPKSTVIIRPDATGSRSYSVDKNLSDHHILREFGFVVQVSAANPSRVDRWAAVNRGYEKGIVKINVKKCPRTVKDLEVISYREGSCEPMLTDPMLGHIGDAMGYAIHKEFPIIGKARQYAYA